MSTKFKYRVNLAAGRTMEDAIQELCSALMLQKHHINYLKHEGTPFISCSESAAAELEASAKIPSITQLSQISVDTDIKTAAL